MKILKLTACNKKLPINKDLEVDPRGYRNQISSYVMFYKLCEEYGMQFILHKNLSSIYPEAVMFFLFKMSNVWTTFE